MLLHTIKNMYGTDRLTDWLPYHAYDPDRQLYANADSTFGFMLEIAPMLFAGEQFVNGLTSVLEQEWPKDSLIQVILYADPNMTGIIDGYATIRNRLLDVSDPREAFLYEWTAWQAQYLRVHRSKGLNEDVPVPFRNFRVFITAKIPCTRADAEGYSTRASDQLSVLRDNLLGMLRSNHVQAVNVTPENLIQVLWQLWNPGHGFLDRNMWDRRTPIREQIVALDTEIVRRTRDTLVDGYRVAVKIPQVSPLNITPMQTNLLLGDLFGSNLQQICCPFVLTLNIDPMPADKAMNFKAEITGMQHSALKALAPKIGRKNEEFSWAAAQMEQGTKFIRGYLTLVLYDVQSTTEGAGTESGLGRFEAMVSTVWGNQGFRLQSEIYAALEYTMAAFPFGLYRAALGRMKRMITAPAHTFSLLAPVQADWRGTQTEAMLFLTRRGQVCALDFFNSDTNYNFAIAAPSGSGKSFLVNKVLQEHASRKGVCYVVDVGRSYKKQCELQMGQYIEFEEGRNMSVNVFSELTADLFALDEVEMNGDANGSDKDRIRRREERATLLTLYTQLLAVMASPRETITDLEFAILSNTIVEAYKMLRPGCVMEIDCFVNILLAQQAANWSGMVFLVISVLLLMGILAVNQVSIFGYFRAYMGPIMLFMVFFGQTAQIRIEDQWAREAYTVDRVPVAIALPLSLCTTAEQAMIELVEKYVMPPASTSLRDFDFFMEAAALSETLNGKTISNYEAQASVARYFDDCVLKGISTGFVNESVYYRSGDLLADSFMPWGVYFTEVTGADGRREVMTCRNAYQRLWTTVAGEAASAAPSGMAGYLSSLFGGRHKGVADTLMAMDSLASNLFPGHQSTSEALFRQTFMINALQSSLAKSNPQALAAISQAEMAQSTGIAAASAVYIKKLPKLRAMMKLVIVGMLPIVAAFFLASFGRPFLQWTAALLSISLWLPLMAVIKATYIASAINELQGMILPTGGVTLPNKLRLMAWVTDTSTVAGTLAFTIPTFAALALQMILPRLALSVGGIVMAAKGSEGFAQRAGMQALQGAERTAKELELDKVNQSFMEAGDTHLARNQRMNELVSGHNNVAFGRDTGTSPLQYNGTNTSAIQGQGYTIQGGMDTRMSQALQESVSMQQAQVQSAQSSAAHNFAMGNGTSRSQNDFEQFVNSLDSSQQQQFSETQQAVKGHTERVAKSYGYEGEEVAQVQRALSAQVHAGGKFDTSEWIPGWIAGKFTGLSSTAGAQATGSTGVTTGESERAKRAAQEIVEAVYNDQQVSAYMQSRSQTLSEADRLGHGQEWAQSASQQEGFQSSMQRVESASQSLTAAQTHMAEQQASFSATAGRSINTGDLLAVSSRGDLELMAMNPGMNRLHGALQQGVNNIDTLRIAANADLSSQLRKAEGGDDNALRSAMHSLDVLSQSNQYNAHDAAIAHQILEQRSGVYAAAAGGGGLPTHGEASNDARMYREAYGSGVDAGGRRLEDSTDTHQPSQPSNGNMRGTFYGEAAPVEPVVPEGNLGIPPAGETQHRNATPELALYATGEVRGALNTASGRLETGQPDSPDPTEARTAPSTAEVSASPSSQWENLPQPFMQAATVNRANLEAEAAASREALRDQVGETQRSLLDQGKQAAQDVSVLDAHSGTFVNGGRVLKGEIIDRVVTTDGKMGLNTMQKDR